MCVCEGVPMKLIHAAIAWYELSAFDRERVLDELRELWELREDAGQHAIALGLRVAVTLLEAAMGRTGNG